MTYGDGAYLTGDYLTTAQLQQMRVQQMRAFGDDVLRGVNRWCKAQITPCPR